MAFWGLVLEPKKSYTQREVEQPFHVSMAALDLQNCDANESVSVVCRKRDSDFILCSLSKKHNVFNVPLNLDFELGGEINFHVLGNSVVHLTGYMIEDMESFEESDDSMGEEEEEESVASSKDIFKNTKKLLGDFAGKRKQDAAAQNKSKKAKLDSSAATEDDDEDEEDSDFDVDTDGDDEDLEEEEEEDDDDDDDDEAEEDDGAAEILQKLEAAKKDKSKQAGKQNNQQVKSSPKAEQKQGKKEKKEQAKPAAAPAPTKAVNVSGNKKKNKKNRNKNKQQNGTAAH